MGEAMLARLGALSSSWTARLAPIVVPALALLLMPPLEHWYGFAVNYDVQGDVQRFESAYTTALLRFSSGFVGGPLVAFALGAALGRSSVHGRPLARPGLAPTLVAGAVAGTVLALANLAVVVPVAAARTELTMSVAQVRAVGLHFHPDLLQDPGFWYVLLVGTVSFPLWAVAGVGIGTLIGPARRLAPLLTAWNTVALVLAGVLLLWSDRRSVVLSAVAVSPPYGAVASAVHIGVNDSTVAMALLLVALAYPAMFATIASTARRPPRRAPH
ncbi:hypothetical protein ACI2K4_06160 [Micromonospora sp. NPDC050397]|uniref:hypothetical protein n=1 Tax=Micromonospora sp. NPDC050397 TaxID=3364279 RepID=UPI00384D0B5B